MMGFVLALLITTVAGGLFAMGREDPICIVLWPGMMLGWAFVFGDNIRSLRDVSGMIILTSLMMNGLCGAIIGASTGYIIRVWNHRRSGNTCEQGAKGDAANRAP
jgi:Na+-translocating ferredoxin:NAD+ oxidoreductase RnfD subunit